MDKKKLRYLVLKALESGEFNINGDTLGVTETEFADTVRFLHREEYIDGVSYPDGKPKLFKGVLVLTEKGENYLDENSTLI